MHPSLFCWPADLFNSLFVFVWPPTYTHPQGLQKFVDEAGSYPMQSHLNLMP